MARDAKEAERGYLARIISAAPLFDAVGEDDVGELARCARSLAIERGKPIAPARGKAENVFFIVGGAAALICRGPQNGGGVLAALMGPGDVIGLVRVGETLKVDAITDGSEWRALSNLTLVAIPIADFLRVMRRSEELSMATLASLAKYMRELTVRHAAALQSPLETRLASLLSQLAVIATGNRWEPQATIARLPQTQIADMLGVSREHVNRTMTMWERSGLILQAKGGDIVIENRKRLSQLAGDNAPSPADAERDAYWEISAHINLGENSAAYDLAMEGVKRAPRDEKFKYFAVLAMARMGALKEALALVDDFKLSTNAKNEDVASIEPRLRRDLAFAGKGAADRAALKKAAEGYEKVFKALGTTYPGVNAAATWAMAGDVDRAKGIAKDVRARAESALDAIDVDDDAYWPRATLAECRLIEGDLIGAASGFASAVAAVDAAPGKIATTRKQLRRLSGSLPIDDGWINAAAPQGAVLFFSGPLATSDDTGAATRLKDRFAAMLEREAIAAAIGALAAGADIIFAEGLIEAGVPLHVHLPLAPNDFLATSVTPAGPEWKERFVACVEAAKTVEWTRRQPPSRAAFRLGAHIAMGRTLRLADDLATEAIGAFAVQKGRTPRESISCENAEKWMSLGRRGETFEDEWPSPLSKKSSDETFAPCFALVVESSSSKDALGDFDPGANFVAVEGGLTVYAFDCPIRAGEAAKTAARSPAGARLRFWLDAGVADIRSEKDRSNFLQTLVTALCRPQTPAGGVFASESFAGAAAATAGDRFRFDYAGVTPTANKLDPCPLYLMDF
ncbi:MAG: Crp/Fnr family transcriptional regulator [Parvularculaceae bacterium]|nr:Crp/Fnr family transcriptional regulator [Parvularculaceae bacterium]